MKFRYFELLNILSRMGAEECVYAFIQEGGREDDLIDVPDPQDLFGCESYVFEDIQKLLVDKDGVNFLELTPTSFEADAEYFSHLQYPVEYGVDEDPPNNFDEKFAIGFLARMETPDGIFAVDSTYLYDLSNIREESFVITLHRNPEKAAFERIKHAHASALLKLSLTYGENPNLTAFNDVIDQVRGNRLDEGALLSDALSVSGDRRGSEFLKTVSIFMRHGLKLQDRPQPVIEMNDVVDIRYYLPQDAEKEPYLTITDIDGSDHIYNVTSGRLVRDKINTSPSHFYDKNKLEMIIANLESQIRDGLVPVEGRVPKSLFRVVQNVESSPTKPSA